MLSQEDKNWAVAAHLSGFAGYVAPFGNVIAPLVIWQVFKLKSAHVSREAREALNFQITIALAAIVGFVLCFVLIGFLLVGALVIADVALMIIAAIKASEGTPFRYPFTLRLIGEDMGSAPPATTTTLPDTGPITPPLPDTQPLQPPEKR
jgi:hypothetical protein